MRARQVAMLALWRAAHRWSSLACTLFLLMSCVTGLPLIFSDEIEELQAPPAVVRGAAVSVEPNNLDAMVQAAVNRYPTQLVRFVFFDDGESKIKVVMAPADVADRSHDHPLVFDAASGALVDEPLPVASRSFGWLQVFNRLHTDLFGGLTGAMVLAAMGFTLVVATVSGVVLYAPYMKKLAFGTVRRRGRRLWWLDLHNLLGIAITMWLLVVGLTGAFNEFSKPLSASWRAGEVNRFKSRQQEPLPREATYPVGAVLHTVQGAMAGNNVTSIIFPSKTFNNPGHFLVWSNGNSPLTYRLFSAAFVDGETGRLEPISQIPAYLRALQLARPMHFGDYGGLALKLLWASLDIIAILVLVSGLALSRSRLVASASTQ
jgi:uncharacterized iron-regulated membrane protein